MQIIERSRARKPDTGFSIFSIKFCFDINLISNVYLFSDMQNFIFTKGLIAGIMVSIQPIHFLARHWFINLAFLASHTFTLGTVLNFQQP